MAADYIPANEEVAVVAFACFVFGISLCTFINCIRWLLFTEQPWKLKNHINCVFVIVALFIMTLSSLCLALVIRSLMDRVHFMSENPLGTSYYAPGWMSLVRCAALNFAALSADVALIYRCWVVYECSLRVVIFPVFLWFGGIACTGMQVYLQIADLHDAGIGPYTWGLANLSTGGGIVLLPFWASTVVLNAYTTFMILRRLYYCMRRPGASSQQLLFIIRIFAESGILYLSVSLAHFVVWFFKNTSAILFLSALNVHIIGIAFHLVIIRAAQNRTFEMEWSVDTISEIQFSSGASSNDDLPTSIKK